MTQAPTDNDLIAACVGKPVAFNRHILGRLHPSLPGGYWSRQIDVLRALEKYRKVCVPGGHGIGKGFLASGAALYFLYTNPNSKVIVLGPSYDQVQTALWPEVTSAWNNARVRLPGRLLNGSMGKIVVDDLWFLLCCTAGTSGEALAGKHASKQLIICDEASWEGYDGVLEDLEGMNASNYLFLGNPLRNNRFRKLCDQGSSDNPNCKTINVSSLESPHAHLARSPVGMADRGYIEDIRSSYGEDSPQWRARVLGQFNDDDVFTLIPSCWLAPTKPHPTHDAHGNTIDHGPKTLSVDISKGTGQGDASAITVKDDDSLLHLEQSSSWTYPEGTLAKVREVATRYSITGEWIRYDRTGLGEAFGHLLYQQGFAGAYGYMGGKDGGTKATNLRGAAALALKRRLDPSLNQTYFHIPQIYLDVLRPQIAELRYELALSGKIKIEEKGAMRGRLGKSPDALDSVIINFSK